MPATVTLLASPEQAKILAELEAEGKLHLSLVYRGSKENASKFIGLQDKVIEALYPKPAQKQSSGNSINNGSTNSSTGTISSTNSSQNSQNTSMESGGR